MRERNNNFIGRFTVQLEFTAAIFVLFCAVSAWSQGKVSIRVEPENIVESDRIKLGDISRVSSGSDSSEKIKNISLGYSPNFGMTREISREQIVLTIAAAGFSDNEVVLNSPSRITVRRAGQEVSPDQVFEVIEKSISSEFAPNNISVKISKFLLPSNIKVPVGKLEIKANPSGVRSLFSKFSMPVEIRVDGVRVHSFSATLEIEAYANVFVATRDLSADAKIGESDIRLEKRRISMPITNYLREPGKIRGLRMIKNVTLGSELTTDSCAPRNVVNLGDSVLVEARSGNLRILIKGEARASGKIGDRIAVRNSQSGAMLQAVIIDEGQVRVIM